MKKIIAFMAAALCTLTVLSAQVLPSQGVENTLSTAFGQPYQVNEDGVKIDEPIHFYGFHETLQARVDISKFTLEGMLNWGALTNYKVDTIKRVVENSGFTFTNTTTTPFTYTNNWYQGESKTNGATDSYYVNFVFHPINHLDMGIGTRLNWSVGPAPAYNGMLWEPTAHLVQGGLKEGLPGQSNVDVAGYMKYANGYARKALAVRFVNEFLEVGAALPSGVTTDSFLTNFAARFYPADWISVGAAVEGVWSGDSNLYFGTRLVPHKDVVVDAWLALDNMGGDSANDIWGTGAAVTIGFPKIGLVIRPEASFSFYERAFYTMAAYTGGSVEFKADKFVLGAWSSYAWGATDTRWYDDKFSLADRAKIGMPVFATTKDYIGGHVFDIRPYVSYQINGNHSVSAMFDYQSRVRFDRTYSEAWASAVYWSYRTSK